MSSYLDRMLKAMEENSMEKCHLGWEKLSPEDAKRIAEVLKRNTSLKELDLYYNNIGNEGAIAIAEALSVNKTLVYLDLNRNYIDKEGAIAVAEALSENKALEVLYLSRNVIRDEGCIAIAGALRKNRHLQWLDLRNKGLISIAESLKENFSLTSLELRNYYGDTHNVFTDEGANALLDTLDVNMTLRKVVLRNTGVSDVLQELIKKKTRRNLSLNSMSNLNPQLVCLNPLVNLLLNPLAKLEVFNVSDLQGKSVSFRKTKIILLGDSGSGKTHTVRELTSEDYVEDRDMYTKALEISSVNSMTWEKDDELNAQELSLASLRGELVAKEVHSHINEGENDQIEENWEEQRILDIEEEDKVAQRSSFTSYLNSLSKNRSEEKKSPSDSDERTIVVDIYDFGGHEVYRVVSHFFMNDWAVYLIVLNLEVKLRQLKMQLSYYVSVVQTFARDAKILVVGTRSSSITPAKKERVKEMTKQVQEDQKTKWIVEVFYVENKKESENEIEDDMEALKTCIKCIVQEMFKEKEPKVPLLWSRMLDNLRRKRENENIQVVKVDDLSKIELGRTLEESDEKKENPSIVKFPPEDINSFIERMKEIGMLYHFDTPEELSNYVILDPNWLTDGMKGVVTIEEAIKLKKENPYFVERRKWTDFTDTGVLTSELLELIASMHWKGKGNEEWKPYFMNLLQQQSLLYRLPVKDKGEEVKYIVPPLLPKNPPKPLPPMSDFLIINLERCFPPLEVYKLSFGLVKAMRGWTYDESSTRYSILLSKEVQDETVFLLFSCYAEEMRQEVSISISEMHLKDGRRNRAVMEDLLSNSRHEINVRCPECDVKFSDKKHCEYVRLGDLLITKSVRCKRYNHSISMEDLFGSASGQGGESNEVDINFKLLLKIVGSKLSAANIDAIAQEYGLPVGECSSVAGLLESLYDLRNIGPDNLNVLLRCLETEEETLAARNSIQKYIDERTNANLGVDGGDIRTPSANNVEQSTAVTNTHIPREQEVMKKSNGEKLDYVIKTLNAVKEDTSETLEKVNCVKEDTSETREKVNAVKEDTSETREKVNAVKEDTSEILEKVNDLLDDVDFIIEDNQKILELLEKNDKKLNKLLENTEPLIKSTLNDSTFLSIDIRENDKEGKRLYKIISNDKSVVYLLVKGKTIYFEFSAYVNNFVVEKVVSVEIGIVMKRKFKKNVLVEDNVKVNRYLKPVPISSESCSIGEDGESVNVYKFSVDWSTTEGSIIAELEPKSIIMVEFIFKFKLEEKSDPVEYRIAINFKIFKENSKMPVNKIKRTLASVYDDIPTPVKILLLGTSRYTAMKTGEDLAAFLQHETLHLAAGAFHSVIENATKETAKGAFKMPKMLLL